MPAHLRRPARQDLGLARAEFAVLARLSTPAKIQAFLNALPANHELSGETILSVRVQQVMGSVVRQIIGRMDGPQLNSVCVSIRLLML